MKKLNLKDIIFILSIVLFSFILIFKGVAFANPIYPASPNIPDEPNSLIKTFFNTSSLLVAVLFNTIIDSVVLLLLSSILRVKQSLKTYVQTIPLIVVIGFVADYIGVFVFDVLDFSNDLSKVRALLISSLIVFSIISIGDSLVIKYLGKRNPKQSIITGVALGILTHPFLWFILFALFKEGIL